MNIYKLLLIDCIEYFKQEKGHKDLIDSYLLQCSVEHYEKLEKENEKLMNSIGDLSRIRIDQMKEIGRLKSEK